MKEIIIAAAAAALGSSGLFAFIQFLINRKDSKNDVLKRMEKTQKSIQRDTTRTQLLVLISDYPENASEILMLAEKYFVQLEGNWYMSSIFNKWLSEREMPKPTWYKH